MSNVTNQVINAITKMFKKRIEMTVAIGRHVPLLFEGHVVLDFIHHSADLPAQFLCLTGPMYSMCVHGVCQAIAEVQPGKV